MNYPLRCSDVLFKAAVKSYSLGRVKLKKSEYMKIAIKAYEQALRVHTFYKFPIQYAGTQNNLGTAYSDMASDPGLPPDGGGR